MPRIVLTGGGTAGHVTPNMALINKFKQEAWQVDYIGSEDGVEKNMIEGMDIPYHVIKSGKLRRYFSWKNFLDPFNILIGIAQSYRLLRTLKPDVVFSKGGFVAFPVVVGAWLNRIPIVAHESDITPGLANRLSFPFVNHLCITFEAAKKHFKQASKIHVTGTPIRPELFQGKKEKGLKFCRLTDQKPCLLVIGGSQGATVLNTCIRQMLEKLTPSFQVIHVCGQGKLDQALSGFQNYCQLEYAHQELADLYAASDLIISRSGANTLYEILALGKPHVLVPLSLKVSRGDQVQNANYFKQLGISVVIPEEELSPETLGVAIDEVMSSLEIRKEKIKQLGIDSATEKVFAIIQQVVHGQMKEISHAG